MKSKLVDSQGNFSKGQTIMETLKKENEDLVKKLKEVDLKDRDFSISEKKLKESLEEAIYSKKKWEDEVYSLKDELVDTTDVYFEQANEHAIFLHPGLCLSSMDLFKWSVMDNWWIKRKISHLVSKSLHLIMTSRSCLREIMW